jgi:SpoVK/Ycf46/Vps4 family AAA+-type ATPase
MGNTKTADIKSFHYLENGNIDFSTLPTVKSCTTLDPGHYVVYYKPYPIDKLMLEIRKDTESIQLLNFSSKDKLDTLMASFFSEEVGSQMKKLGLFHKVGVLLHGKEGTGKSSIIKYYLTELIRNNKAIVFHLKSSYALNNEVWPFIQRIREIQDNPVVIVMDEFDAFVEGKEQEAIIKRILDGGEAIDTCLIFAATNYIESIPDTIKNRPSRFKYTIEIGGIEDVADINTLITNLLGNKFSKEEIENVCYDLKGKTLDEIKHFCLDKLMDLTVNKVTKKVIGFKIGETIITN